MVRFGKRTGTVVRLSIAVAAALVGLLVLIGRGLMWWYDTVVSFNIPEAVSFMIFTIPFLLAFIALFVIWCMNARY